MDWDDEIVIQQGHAEVLDGGCDHDEMPTGWPVGSLYVPNPASPGGWSLQHFYPVIEIEVPAPRKLGFRMPDQRTARKKVKGGRHVSNPAVAPGAPAWARPAAVAPRRRSLVNGRKVSSK